MFVVLGSFLIGVSVGLWLGIQIIEHRRWHKPRTREVFTEQALEEARASAEGRVLILPSKNNMSLGKE